MLYNSFDTPPIDEIIAMNMQISGRTLLAAEYALDDIPYQLQKDEKCDLDLRTARIIISTCQDIIEDICFSGKNPKDYIEVCDELKQIIEHTLEQ